MTPEELKARFSEQVAEGTPTGLGGIAVKRSGGNLFDTIGDIGQAIGKDMVYMIQSIPHLPAAIMPTGKPGVIGAFDESVDEEERAHRRRALADTAMIFAGMGFGKIAATLASPAAHEAGFLLRGLLGTEGAAAFKAGEHALINKTIGAAPGVRKLLSNASRAAFIGGGLENVIFHSINHEEGEEVNPFLDAAIGGTFGLGAHALFGRLHGLSKGGKAGARALEELEAQEAANRAESVAWDPRKEYADQLRAEAVAAANAETERLLQPARNTSLSDLVDVEGQGAQVEAVSQRATQLYEDAYMESAKKRAAVVDAAKRATEALRREQLANGDTSWLDDHFRRTARILDGENKSLLDVVRSEYTAPTHRTLKDTIFAEVALHPALSGESNNLARLAVASHILDRPVSTFDSLTHEEGVQLLNTLRVLRGEAPLVVKAPPRFVEAVTLSNGRGTGAAVFADAEHQQLYNLGKPVAKGKKGITLTDAQRAGLARVTGLPEGSVQIAARMYRDFVDNAVDAVGVGMHEMPTYDDFVNRYPEFRQSESAAVLEALQNKMKMEEALRLERGRKGTARRVAARRLRSGSGGGEASGGGGSGRKGSKAPKARVGKAGATEGVTGATEAAAVADGTSTAAQPDIVEPVSDAGFKYGERLRPTEAGGKPWWQVGRGPNPGIIREGADDALVAAAEGDVRSPSGKLVPAESSTAAGEDSPKAAAFKREYGPRIAAQEQVIARLEAQRDAHPVHGYIRRMADSAREQLGRLQGLSRELDAAAKAGNSEARAAVAKRLGVALPEAREALSSEISELADRIAKIEGTDPEGVLARLEAVTPAAGKEAEKEALVTKAKAALRSLDEDRYRHAQLVDQLNSTPEMAAADRASLEASIKDSPEMAAHRAKIDAMNARRARAGKRLERTKQVAKRLEQQQAALEAELGLPTARGSLADLRAQLKEASRGGTRAAKSTKTIFAKLAWKKRENVNTALYSAEIPMSAQASLVHRVDGKKVYTKETLVGAMRMNATHLGGGVYHVASTEHGGWLPSAKALAELNNLSYEEQRRVRARYAEALRTLQTFLADLYFNNGAVAIEVQPNSAAALALEKFTRSVLVKSEGAEEIAALHASIAEAKAAKNWGGVKKLEAKLAKAQEIERTTGFPAMLEKQGKGVWRFNSATSFPYDLVATSKRPPKIGTDWFLDNRARAALYNAGVDPTTGLARSANMEVERLTAAVVRAEETAWRTGDWTEATALKQKLEQIYATGEVPARAPKASNGGNQASAAAPKGNTTAELEAALNGNPATASAAPAPGGGATPQRVRVIIAGGRAFNDEGKLTRAAEAVVKHLRSQGIEVGEVVSGGATGADSLGEAWATKSGIPVKRFDADWKTHGKGAGPRRNKEMADYGDVLVALPGGRGTANMVKTMRAAGKQVFDFTTSEEGTFPKVNLKANPASTAAPLAQAAAPQGGSPTQDAAAALEAELNGTGVPSEAPPVTTAAGESLPKGNLPEAEEAINLYMALHKVDYETAEQAVYAIHASHPEGTTLQRSMQVIASDLQRELDRVATTPTTPDAVKAVVDAGASASTSLDKMSARAGFLKLMQEEGVSVTPGEGFHTVGPLEVEWQPMRSGGFRVNFVKPTGGSEIGEPLSSIVIENDNEAGARAIAAEYNRVMEQLGLSQPKPVQPASTGPALSNASSAAATTSRFARPLWAPPQHTDPEWLKGKVFGVRLKDGETHFYNPGELIPSGPFKGTPIDSSQWAAEAYLAENPGRDADIADVGFGVVKMIKDGYGGMKATDSYRYIMSYAAHDIEGAMSREVGKTWREIALGKVDALWEDFEPMSRFLQGRSNSRVQLANRADVASVEATVGKVEEYLSAATSLHQQYLDNKVKPPTRLKSIINVCNSFMERWEAAQPDRGVALMQRKQTQKTIESIMNKLDFSTGGLSTGLSDNVSFDYVTRQMYKLGALMKAARAGKQEIALIQNPEFVRAVEMVEAVYRDKLKRLADFSTDAAPPRRTAEFEEILKAVEALVGDLDLGQFS